MEKIRREILSNPELAKMLLQPDEDEKVYIGGNCKIIICSQPANLKFVLCDVEIEDQDCTEKESIEKKSTKESAENEETQEKKLIVNMEPTEASETQEKLIINLESTEAGKTQEKLIINTEPTEISEIQEKLIVNNNWTDICLKEMKSLKKELIKNNLLLESILNILQQNINMPGSLPCCSSCKEIVKDT